MSGPTPGEWTYDRFVMAVFLDDSWDEICLLPLRSRDADANGRLIAAAPELLAMVERFLAICDDVPGAGLDEAIADARALVANTRGGP